MTKDRVIFRKFPEGDVIALFPGIGAYNERILCYQHIGQHGETCLDFVEELQPATPEEYKDLLDELTAIGYDVEVCNE